MLEDTTTKRLVILTFMLLLHFGLDSTAFAGNWPEILGPKRNGHAIGETIAADWSNRPPIRRWTRKVGEGYAGPAVVGEQVVVFHRNGTAETLDCLSANSGEPLWSKNWKSSYGGGIDRDRGPRCVPLIHGTQIFVFDAGGELRCVNLTDGKILWSRKLAKDYKAQDGYFGFGSSPIVVGDVLMVNVGGQRGSSIVAVALDSGKTLWTTMDDQASYSAPTWWTDRNGRQSAIFITRMNLIGVNPTDGKTLFRTPFGARGPTVNAATPIVVNSDRIFITASYRVGAKCISLQDLKKLDVLWESDDILSSQYPTPVLRNGHLYGVHGREDGPPASLRCIDANDGKIKWKKDSVGMAHLIVADDKLLMLTISGELVLLALSTDRYHELGRLRVSDAKTRALPALSNGRLFIRDTDGLLAAWELPK